MFDLGCGVRNNPWQIEGTVSSDPSPCSISSLSTMSNGFEQERSQHLGICGGEDSPPHICLHAEFAPAQLHLLPLELVFVFLANYACPHCWDQICYFVLG